MRQTGVEISVSKATEADLAFLNWENTKPHQAGNVFEVPISGGVVQNSNTTVLVAKSKGEILGFASVKIIDSRKQRLGEVVHFGVNPKFWRRRIGNKLLGAVNSFLIKNNVEKGFLVSSDKGMPFYQNSNWVLKSKNNQSFNWFPKPNPRIKVRRKK